MEAFVATIWGRFSDASDESELRRTMSSRIAPWARIHIAFDFILAASFWLNHCLSRGGTHQSVQDVGVFGDFFSQFSAACLLIELTGYMLLWTRPHLQPQAWVWLSCLCHRMYHIVYLAGLAPMTPIAMAYLINGKEEMLLATFTCSVMCNILTPISFPELLLTRVFLDGLSFLLYQQTAIREGVELSSLQQALSRFLLAALVGFLNDWSRRRAFLQTLRLRQAGHPQILNRADSHHSTLSKEDISISSSDDYSTVIESERNTHDNPHFAFVAQEDQQDLHYRPIFTPQRITLRISGVDDDALMNRLKSPEALASFQAHLKAKGMPMTQLNIRKGSIIVEIETLMPTSAAATDVNYGQWLDALKLHEMSSISDGSVVSITVAGQFLYFAFDQAKLSWAPLKHSPSDASPLVSTISSLISRLLPCCHSISFSSKIRVKQVTFSAIWLEDGLDDSITSLEEFGIKIEAVHYGRPLTVAVHPTKPCKWRKGQMVHFVVTLPESCLPGIVSLNLWSASSAALSKAAPPVPSSPCPPNKPCIMVMSRPLLILPPGCSDVVTELDHLRGKTANRCNVDGAMSDISRLLAAQLKAFPKAAAAQEEEEDRSHLMLNTNKVPLETIKTNLIAWCMHSKLPRTLDFVQSINLGPPAASDLPAVRVRSSGFHPLWVLFNVAKFILALSLSLQGSPAELALLIWTGSPYVILLFLMIKRKLLPTSPSAAAPPLASHRPTFLHITSHWLFVENLGLLLHLQRLVNVFLMVAGILSPVRGTPYDPLSKNAKNYWRFNALMRGSNMLMEAYDIRVAAVVILLLDTPSVYLYSTRVMGIPHSNALIPSMAQILMGLVIQSAAALVRIRGSASTSRQVAASSNAMRSDAQDAAGPSTSGSDALEQSAGKNKKTN